MIIYECKPGNMPEDFGLSGPLFVIGDTIEEIDKDFIYEQYYPIHNIGLRKNNTWCGEHPRYYRELTTKEKIKYEKV